jgi:DNA-binding IclR family transcriptional regulator
MTDRSVTTVDGLLAELDETRRAGYAIDREQAALGRCAIGVPIRRGAAELLGRAAISLSASVTDFDMRVDGLLDRLLAARDRIERDGNARLAWAGLGASDESLLDGVSG